MQAKDIIVETASDTRDIHMASQWLADRITHHQMGQGQVFTVHDIFTLDKSDTLPIDYGNVSDMLLDNDLGFLIDKPQKTKGNTLRFGAFYPNRNLIYINRDLIKKGIPKLASTIGHELRHALDFMLSRGKPFRSKQQSSQTHDQYLRDPQEINARFTQAMWAMAFDTIDKQPTNPQAALALIDDCLVRLNLGRDMFPDGPKGDKRFNRLRSRAIRYWMQVARFLRSEQVEDLPKPTLMSKLKSFILRFKLT